MTKEFSFKIQLKDSLLLSKNKKRESTLIEHRSCILGININQKQNQ